MNITIETSDDIINIEIQKIDLDDSIAVFRYFSRNSNSEISLNGNIYKFAYYSTGVESVDKFIFEHQRVLKNE